MDPVVAYITGGLGFAAALITGMFAWLSQRTKGEIDLSATVMGEWQKLIAAHQLQIKGLVEEISDLRSRLATAEKEIMELRAEYAEHREHAADEIRHRDETITSLNRMIAQNSQSSAALLEPSVGDRAPTATARFKEGRFGRRQDDKK